jgi:dienelactone hydrolase
MRTHTFIKILMTGIAFMNIASTAYSKNPSQSITEEVVTYESNGVTLKGVVAYDKNIKGKRPAIIVVHEWWGLTDYARMRAHKLAELGYIALAADMYGDGKIAADPKAAQSFAMPFYQDPSLAKSRLDAAIKKIKEFSQTDQANIAAIGYCFGGFVVLNSAKLGADLKGVVSFHGGLGGTTVNKDLLKAKILICHGASDKFVSLAEADNLKHKLDSIGADNTLKIYADATHAFTNPDATKMGKEFNMPIEYNVKADTDSWNDMKVFLNRIFKNQD